MLTYHPRYFYSAIALFLIEVFIAVYVKDRFIRPFVGDILVVILIYCLVKAFCKVRANVAIAAVFIFDCLVEGLQYLNVVDMLGIRQNKLLVIILGSSFDWGDILAYAGGGGIVWWYENIFKKRRKS